MEIMRELKLLGKMTVEVPNKFRLDADFNKRQKQILDEIFQCLMRGLIDGCYDEVDIHQVFIIFVANFDITFSPFLHLLFCPLCFQCSDPPMFRHS